MPVVPFTPVAPREPKPVEFTPVEEPWALMAAAQMDVEGRLTEPNIDDRRDQGRKETDNRMVEDQQLPRSDYGDMDKDTFGKLNKLLGTSELDAAERDNIVKAIQRGMAVKGGK